LQGIVPSTVQSVGQSRQLGNSASPIITEALSVTSRGRELFELMCAHDLEGIVAKRLADRYDPQVQWLKIKNPDYGAATCSMGCGSGDRGSVRMGGDALIGGRSADFVKASSQVATANRNVD